MRTITATQLRKNLGEMLDAASAGERILVERDRRPLAYLLSIEDGRSLNVDDEEVERELAALDALVALGEEWRRSHVRQPGEMTAEDTVRWDRDHRDEEKWERSLGGDRGEPEADDAPGDDQ